MTTSTTIHHTPSTAPLSHRSNPVRPGERWRNLSTPTAANVMYPSLSLSYVQWYYRDQERGKKSLSVKRYEIHDAIRLESAASISLHHMRTSWPLSTRNPDHASTVFAHASPTLILVRSPRQSGIFRSPRRWMFCCCISPGCGCYLRTSAHFVVCACHHAWRPRTLLVLKRVSSASIQVECTSIAESSAHMGSPFTAFIIGFVVAD